METSTALPILATHPEAVNLVAHDDPEASHRPLSASVAAHLESVAVEHAVEAPHRRLRLPEQRQLGHVATEPEVQATPITLVAGMYRAVVNGKPDELVAGYGSKSVRDGLRSGKYITVELGEQ